MPCGPVFVSLLRTTGGVFSVVHRTILAPGDVAQMVERAVSIGEVKGSMPFFSNSCPRGAMDSALDFESRGCGFESHRGFTFGVPL